ncbi:hypothetical protein CTA2_11957 [Colletotrichum tanaceti]|uniref:DUF7587 domain-containing protein n=1 Tax=Colletotrichum tanaceti TaxID=1306861 RepID=A0A4U6X4A1_9PEZI|nr:hypothetical protein CTA2_11957 [Colletotrichum tanaceti]TKW50198.1 hypothetical protein CTA1_6562 [Colletotrichum tanaceti]
MASVASKAVTVAQYRPRVQKIAEHDSEDIVGWLTKNTAAGLPWVLRVKREFYDILMTQFPEYLSLIGASRLTGVVNGIALVSISHQVHTVSERVRPQTLYRVIHRGQPGRGLKSRLGRGSDPIFFQLHLQKHLRWRCRDPSPFLSATNNWDEAMQIAAEHVVRNFDRVEVIGFQTSGPGWNHDVQRLWRVKILMQQLWLKKSDRPHLKNEFLVEHSIPEDSIVLREAAPGPDSVYMRNARRDLERKKKAAEDQTKPEESKNTRACVFREAAGKRKTEVEGPAPKKRKTGKWVKVGIKIGRNVGSA